MMTLKTGRRSFTFIELILVIALIGILSVVAIPQFRKTFNDLQLNNFARDLQSFMNYLEQRSIVERKIITLNVDDVNKEYWAQIKDEPNRLKTYSIPKEINTETNQSQIRFYPDGQIDAVTISLINPSNQRLRLTTEGVFGGVKILQE